MVATMKMKDMPPLPKGSEWVAMVDPAALEKDFKELGKKMEEGQGEEDREHLFKIINYALGFQFIGWATMWMNPLYMFPAFFFSLGTFARWTMVGHHVSHGGYNNCTPKTSKYQRFTFAVGSVFNRLMDWPDWMLPEAWDVEHNHYHHYSLNEADDPDLVERNLAVLRDAPVPKFLKYGVVLWFALTWKWFYYAVNTFILLRTYQGGGAGGAETEKQDKFYVLSNFITGSVPKFVTFMEYFCRVAAPYMAFLFVILPLPYLLGLSFLGDSHPVLAAWCSSAYKNAFINLLLADVMTNIHSFIVITTNHAGHDMYRYKTHVKALSGAFFIRAIVSSANYDAGTDFVDFWHGWLNYQVEHHCFPKLSMRSYQKLMPEVKKLAKKHNVPYIQENVFIRLKKTVDSMVGNTTMREIPLEWEHYLNQKFTIQNRVISSDKLVNMGG